VDSIVPPHTVTSLKGCIAKIEGIHSSSRCQLFNYLESEAPVDDGPLSILAGDCPGSTVDRPIALVFSASCDSPTTLIDMPPEFSAFTKQIRGKEDCRESHIVGDPQRSKY
jgi:hypothetical protein